MSICEETETGQGLNDTKFHIFLYLLYFRGFFYFQSAVLYHFIILYHIGACFSIDIYQIINCFFEENMLEYPPLFDKRGKI